MKVSVETIRAERPEPDASFPIAIIGMSCKFSGGATYPEKLCELCEQGKSGWSEIPSTRFNYRAFHDENREKVGITIAQGGHFINEDIVKFDATFFNFSHEVASIMDPQIRLQLESVFEATENTVISLERLEGSNTSVFAGVLSDAGKCYAWDDRASGYGRGEGITTLILKPLTQAIADGDSIRAIIRGTAVNQDGKTPTITSPSAKAQEDVIRECYRRASLNPKDTPYVEAHMTGTMVGDPIEAKAISSIFTKDRTLGDSMIVGSIKINLGHMEATSGLAGVIKTVLAFERGVIPPSLNFDRPNPAIDLENWKLKPQGVPRRASVNNFGYGGTNAHAILEAFKPIDSQRHSLRQNGRFSNSFDEHGNPVPTLTDNTSDANNPVVAKSLDCHSEGKESEDSGRVTASSTEVSRIFLLSSKESDVTNRMRLDLARCIRARQVAAENVDLASLSYTLYARRSKFPWRFAISADSVDGLVTTLETIGNKPVMVRAPPLIGFVFNGQGAQWAAMGREMFVYEILSKAMAEADSILRFFGADWSLIDELHKDKTTSRVHHPSFSQPLRLSLQLALKYLSTLKRGGQAVIACINSHSSVTISGDESAIEEIEKQLKENGHFARKLKVQAAYHSHHMLPMADDNLRSLERSSSQNKPGITRCTAPQSLAVKSIILRNWELRTG
ncbi:putative PKS-like protein biosynthetic cluster [Venturia effusa]|uniref:Putative PKS-like protein biosynthetic cluster n=1 Tax=Venturia effusa TaxID=50376 RepID=A0A517LRC5_9PEZI|nr:putative PKS-like protein biosynthetic cluster [Venturia effusa]